MSFFRGDRKGAGRVCMRMTFPQAKTGVDKLRRMRVHMDDIHASRTMFLTIHPHACAC
jgi:hypothetical protein